MVRAFLLLTAIAAIAPATARAAGYALHGTYLDYGPAQGAARTPHRVPAVLFVAVRGHEVRLQLSAPGARCVPEFGASGYVGHARGEGSDTLAAHVQLKGDCFHVSDDARLYLRFSRERPRSVSSAELTDYVRVLFEAH